MVMQSDLFLKMSNINNVFLQKHNHGLKKKSIIFPYHPSLFFSPIESLVIESMWTPNAKGKKINMNLVSASVHVQSEINIRFTD